MVLKFLQAKKIRSVTDEKVADFSKSGTAAPISNLMKGKEAFKSADIGDGHINGFVKGHLNLEIE